MNLPTVGRKPQSMQQWISSLELHIDSDAVRKWKAMLVKMPDYQIDTNGEVKEWTTPLLTNPQVWNVPHLYEIYNGLPEEIANNTTLLNAFEITFEKKLDMRRKEFAIKKPRSGFAAGMVCQAFCAASLHKAEDCKEIIGWLSDWFWSSNMATTHNVDEIFNTDLSGGLPAVILRMLVDSQPGWIELFPAWPADMPPGKIEGVALRGQIVLKELSWNGKNITAILCSAVPQKIQLKTTGKIKSITGDKNIQITKENDEYYLLLSENQDASLKIAME
jgi:alpha-L-fucosidase 2